MNPCGLSDATCFESLPAVRKRDKILLVRDLKRTGPKDNQDLTQRPTEPETRADGILQKLIADR
jgi:hypothetical protein